MFDEFLTLGEALSQAQRHGKSPVDAEIVLCGQAAAYLDEQAEQILTPVNSRSRKILQDMSLAIRAVSNKCRRP